MLAEDDDDDENENSKVRKMVSEILVDNITLRRQVSLLFQNDNKRHG